MKVVRYLAAAAGVVAVLILPASASAHPSVYTDLAIIDTNPVVDQFTLENQTRHVVINHGFTTVLRESNGVTDKGVFTYAKLPGDYRKTLTWDQLLAAGATGAQAHATCKGVAALETEDAIRGWQGDPFYGYVPFQANAAGLDDTPSDWIGDVLALTGVDLATNPDPAAACVGLGGTYVPADATQNTIASLASGSLHPLEEEIAELKAEKDTLTAEVAALKAEAAQLRMAATTMRIDKNGAASTFSAAAGGSSLKLQGPAGKSVLVRLLASNKNQAKKLGLKSRVLASVNAKFGEDGTATIKLTPSGAPAAALKKASGSVKVLYQAISGDRVVAIRSTLNK